MHSLMALIKKKKKNLDYHFHPELFSRVDILAIARIFVFRRNNFFPPESHIRYRVFSDVDYFILLLLDICIIPSYIYIHIYIYYINFSSFFFISVIIKSREDAHSLAASKNDPRSKNFHLALYSERKL